MGLIDRLLGNTSAQQIKKIQPLVKKINALEDGIKKLSDYGKMLLIKRSKIVAGAYNKLDKLKKIMTLKFCYSFRLHK